LDRDEMTALWNLPELRAGLWFGGAATLALLIAGIAVSVRALRKPLPLGGAVIIVGGLWIIADQRHLPAAVLVSVIGIGAVAGLEHTRWVSRWQCIALALPFALVIGFGGELVTDVWVRLLVTVAVSVGAMLAADFDGTWRREAPGLMLFAISALGVYVAVPDTELAAAVLGVSLPLVLLGWPACLASLGRSGAAGATSLLVWAGAAGGAGRPASIVAVVSCLGLLAGAPAGKLLLPGAASGMRRLREPPLLVALAASHAAIVAIAARAVGPRTSPLTAAGIATFIGGAAVLTGAMFRPPSQAIARARVD
jgi:hypothetical protein